MTFINNTMGKSVMTIDRYVLAIAGGFIIISVLLAMVHSLYWLHFTTFVGINLLQIPFHRFLSIGDSVVKVEY